MKAYKYNKETKKYEGEVMRHRDPLESQKAGHDVWLMPANSTDVEPLEQKDGVEVVWDGAAWEYQEIPQPEPEPAPTEEEIKQARIAELQSQLASTDYVVIKIAEAETQEEQSLLREHYSSVITNRKKWREEINTLEQ